MLAHFFIEIEGHLPVGGFRLIPLIYLISSCIRLCSLLTWPFHERQMRDQEVVKDRIVKCQRASRSCKEGQKLGAFWTREGAGWSKARPPSAHGGLMHAHACLRFILTLQQSRLT